MQQLKRLLTNDDATTSVEYAVMITLILLVLFAGVTSVGSGTAAWFTNVDTEMQNQGM